MAKTRIMVSEERVKKYLQDPTDDNFFLAVLGILNLNPIKDGIDAYSAFRRFQDAVLKRESPNQNHVKILDEAVSSTMGQTSSRLNSSNMTNENSESRLTHNKEDRKSPYKKAPNQNVTLGFSI